MNPTLIAYAIIAAVLFASGLATGNKWANGRHAKAAAKAQEEYQKAYKKEVDRGNALAQQVEEAKARVGIRTVEIIKRLPAVTDGRRCLGSGAISLLNSTGSPGLRLPAGEPDGQSAAAPSAAGGNHPAEENAASDIDVANWIATANGQYDNCAGQLNALIDFEQK